MRNFKEEGKWLDGFMALADRADAAMGDSLRSYAAALLREMVMYATTPLQLDGEPVGSNLEAGILALGTIIDLAVIPLEKIADEFSKKWQWWKKVEEEIMSRIATADAEGILSLIRWLSLRSLMEVKLKPSFPVPHAQSKMFEKTFLFSSPNEFTKSDDSVVGFPIPGRWPIGWKPKDIQKV